MSAGKSQPGKTLFLTVGQESTLQVSHFHFQKARLEFEQTGGSKLQGGHEHSPAIAKERVFKLLLSGAMSNSHASLAQSLLTSVSV